MFYRPISRDSDYSGLQSLWSETKTGMADTAHYDPDASFEQDYAWQSESEAGLYVCRRYRCWIPACNGKGRIEKHYGIGKWQTIFCKGNDQSHFVNCEMERRNRIQGLPDARFHVGRGRIQ